jgi:hypothetical protein
MSDGDSYKQALVLRERVERGTLGIESLRLAAYIGVPAAAIAVEGRLPGPLSDVLGGDSSYAQAARGCRCRTWTPNFDELLWFRGLAHWGHYVVARAAIALMRPLQALARDPELVARFFAAADAWAANPGPETHARVESITKSTFGEVASYFRVHMFIRVVSSPSQYERGIERRSLLSSLEAMICIEMPKHGPLDLASVYRELGMWALSTDCIAHIKLDEARPLPNDTTLRLAAIEAQTSHRHLRLIDEVDALANREVELHFMNGTTLHGDLPGRPGVHDFLICCEPALTSVDFDSVASIQPIEGVRG